MKTVFIKNTNGSRFILHYVSQKLKTVGSDEKLHSKQRKQSQIIFKTKSNLIKTAKNDNY